MAKKPKEKLNATIAIRNPGKMTKEQRQSISDWLRNSADKLENEGENYTTDTFWAHHITVLKTST